MGRIATAIAELVCVVLLLVPKTSVLGAIGSVGVISGAIMAHLTKLGVSIDPVALGNENLAPLEGPSLFIMAVVVFISSLVIIAIRRTQIPDHRLEVYKHQARVLKNKQRAFPPAARLKESGWCGLCG